ncbi:MAG: hypothetical protein J3K34DRAFT_523101 [Monoraphidium minutum]|nr:MAG: hypothetical protein J3K34DRAFT_523101 [Monoraphidium minutum]
MAWGDAATAALSYVYLFALQLESHPHRARAALLPLSAATCAAHAAYALLDRAALAPNALGLLLQAALQAVLRARAWPAVPLGAPALAAAAALAAASQLAWAWLLLPRGGSGVAAVARLWAVLAGLVWPVPAGVLLTLAVAADPLPLSDRSGQRLD